MTSGTGEKQVTGKEATQFQPGQSGNPGGRPKGSGKTTAALYRILEDDAQADLLAKALLRLAKKGNAAAIKQVMDRVDGPITEKVDTNLTIHVEYGDDPSAGDASRPGEGEPGSEEV